MSDKIVTFGEIMLRLSPRGNKRFIHADGFDLTFGGGEANVAVSLACFGQNTSYVTKLPENELGQAAINELRKYGVDTTHIVRGGERIGIYFLEKGASQRPSKVIYDRKGSAIAEALPSEFDFDKIFEGAVWFHLTGITPALSKNVVEICLSACKKAKEKGITVSFDINYRKNLWSSEEACEVLSAIMPYVDILISNEGDIRNVFGIKFDDFPSSDEEQNKARQIEIIKTVCARFPIKKVALTMRTSLSADDNILSAVLYDGCDYFFSKSYPIHIVDRVGSGDSFAAGLIHALLSGYPSQASVEFATAAACLKHTIEGDFNLVSEQEVLNLANGDTSGRIQR